MEDLDIDRFITDGLLAYFRSGESFAPIQSPAMAFAESQRLLQLHWAFSPDMQSLLKHLLRQHGEVVSSSTIGVQETTGSIRGPGIWPQTYLRRQVTANPSIVMYRDIRRNYDVGPNRVLQIVILNALRSLETYAGRPDLSGTPYGLSIRQTANLAIRARRVMELRQIASPLAASRLREPSTQDVQQASQSSRRLYILAAKLYQLHRSIALHRLDSLREMLSGTLVSPLFAWQRFELFAVLHLGLALQELLRSRAHLRDLTGAMRGPAITVGSLSIYWGVRPPGALQPRLLPPRRQRVESMLQRFGLSPRTGRSDITIVDSGQMEVLAIVECKYSAGGADESSRQFREAANQVVDYVEDYEGDANKRLTKSAIAMRRLPTAVAARGGIAGPSDLIALSARDLLQGSESLREWLRRLNTPSVHSQE